jgi:hypothetical protein
MEEIKIGIIGHGKRGFRYTAEDLARLNESGMKIISLEDALNDEEIIAKAQEADIDLDDIKDAIVVGPGYIDKNIHEQIFELINEIKVPEPPQLQIETGFYNNRAGRRAQIKADRRRNRK